METAQWEESPNSMRNRPSLLRKNSLDKSFKYFKSKMTPSKKEIKEPVLKSSINHFDNDNNFNQSMILISSDKVEERASFHSHAK